MSITTTSSLLRLRFPLIRWPSEVIKGLRAFYYAFAVELAFYLLKMFWEVDDVLPRHIHRKPLRL